LEGSSDNGISIFAHTGGPYFVYGLQLLHSPLIIQDATPKFVDAPVSLIFKK